MVSISFPGIREVYYSFNFSTIFAWVWIFNYLKEHTFSRQEFSKWWSLLYAHLLSIAWQIFSSLIRVLMANQTLLFAWWHFYLLSLCLIILINLQFCSMIIPILGICLVTLIILLQRAPKVPMLSSHQSMVMRGIWTHIFGKKQGFLTKELACRVSSLISSDSSADVTEVHSTS